MPGWMHQDCDAFNLRVTDFDEAVNAKAFLAATAPSWGRRFLWRRTAQVVQVLKETGNFLMPLAVHLIFLRTSIWLGQRAPRAPDLRDHVQRTFFPCVFECQ